MHNWFNYCSISLKPGVSINTQACKASTFQTVYDFFIAFLVHPFKASHIEPAFMDGIKVGMCLVGKEQDGSSGSQMSTVSHMVHSSSLLTWYSFFSHSVPLPLPLIFRL
jgi:hypothetical protein